MGYTTLDGGTRAVFFGGALGSDELEGLYRADLDPAALLEGAPLEHLDAASAETPGPRRDAAVAYHVWDQAVYLFGGTGPDGALNDQWLPRIEGTQVVWTDQRNEPAAVWPARNTDIYHHDLTTGKTTRVTTDPGTQERPDVWGDWVVWMDWRNSPGGVSQGGKAPDCDVYGKNLKTGQVVQLAGGSGHQAYARVDRDRAFFTMRDAQGEISAFMIDLKQRFGR